MATTSTLVSDVESDFNTVYSVLGYELPAKEEDRALAALRRNYERLTAAGALIERLLCAGGPNGETWREDVLALRHDAQAWYQDYRKAEAVSTPTASPEAASASDADPF